MFITITDNDIRFWHNDYTTFIAKTACSAMNSDWDKIKFYDVPQDMKAWLDQKDSQIDLKFEDGKMMAQKYRQLDITKKKNAKKDFKENVGEPIELALINHKE